MPDFPYSVRMSTTSGPVLPVMTGNSSDFPSGSFRVAVLSAMVVYLLNGAQSRHDVLEVGLVPVATPGNDVPQIVVREIEQLAQRAVIRMPYQVALEQDIELKQSPAAFPSEPLALDLLHHSFLRRCVYPAD